MRMFDAVFELILKWGMMMYDGVGLMQKMIENAVHSIATKY